MSNSLDPDCLQRQSVDRKKSQLARKELIMHTKLGLISLAQGQNAVTPVRLEPAAPQSRVKHSTTEPLRSLAAKTGKSSQAYLKSKSHKLATLWDVGKTYQELAILVNRKRQSNMSGY